MGPKEGIGDSPERADAREKVAGTALFTADLACPDAWIGTTVRSPVPRGRIRSLSLDPDFDTRSIVFLTAKTLPGPNVVAMIRDDHPILADEEVRFFSEPVALLAAPDRDMLEKARRAVRLEIDELPPVLGIEASLAREQVIWGEDNVISEYRFAEGEVEAALSRADLVCEETYRTGHQEHLYLEPNGILASPHEGGGVLITGSLQCPFYVRRALVKALALSEEQVLVRQAVTGGAFGGKEDFPSVLAAHAALLALRCGRPVKMLYGRTEDIRSTTKRHPSRTRIRAGVDRNGTLLAVDIDLVLDAGACTTLSPVVLSRALLHACGAYRVPNAAVRGRAVATNTPPNGAFRGFGAPQSLFAIERHMDRIARALSLDPLEIRRKNLLRTGDRLPFGQVLRDPVGASLVLERAVAMSGYEARKRTAPARGPLRGMGLSLFLHGGGFTGSGEEKIAGRARVAVTADRVVEIRVSNVEMGQGASTVLAMIAARALGIPLRSVRQAVPDTAEVPDTGPTVASRTTMVVGKIVLDACLELARKVGLAPGAEGMEEPAGAEGREDAAEERFFAAAERYLREHGSLEAEARYVARPGASWDDAAYRGDAYQAWSWGANVTEVDVDPDTCEVRPRRVTAVVEIGRAIHPVLAAGQVEGGTLQSLGFAGLEEMKLADGRFLNDRMATYTIPTALDAPSFIVELLELPSPCGPFGAKGLGELPADGAGPSLAAAVTDATGLFPGELPITPERLLALQEAAAEKREGDGLGERGEREQPGGRGERGNQRGPGDAGARRKPR